MITNTLFVAMVMATFWGMWSRRSARGCRWETAPTLMIALGGATVYLVSPYANWLGTLLHALTGRWNLEDHIGHNLGLLCCCAAVYTCLVRLGDAEMVREYYAWRVALPASAALAVMQCTFAMAPDANVLIPEFEDIKPTSDWLIAYWLIYLSTAAYLLLLAARLVWRLRQVGLAPTKVANLYMTGFGLTVVFTAALAFHVYSPYDIGEIAWTIGYAAMVVLAIAPAYSWRLKSRPLFPDVMPLVNADTEEW